MKLGVILKTKRKELSLTQEQVAAKLGVSAPAVNKWENGNSYPDILLLGPLARLLGIDVNTLLGFREDLSEHELLEISQKLSSCFKEEGYEAGCRVGEALLREYPSCGRLSLLVGQLMETFLLFSPMPEESQKEGEARAVELIRAAACDSDRRTADGALSYLATIHLRKGSFEEAEAILNQLPEQTIDKNALRTALAMKRGQYEEAACAYEQQLFQHLNTCVSTLNLYANLCLKKGELDKAKRLAKLFCQTVELYELRNQPSLSAHLLVATYEKDVSETWRCLEESLRHYTEEHAQDMGNTFLFSRIPLKNPSSTAQKMLAEMMLSSLRSDEDMAFLREDASFEERYERLAAICDTPQKI